MDHDPLEKPAEPGAYIGREPERQAETIPGGVQPDDERIAAHSTQREVDPDLVDSSSTGGEGDQRSQQGPDSQGQS